MPPRKKSPSRRAKSPAAAAPRKPQPELRGRCARGRVASVRALASALTRGSTVFRPRSAKKASVVVVAAR